MLLRHALDEHEVYDRRLTKDTKDVVILHEGSTLGEHIVHTWRHKHGEHAGVHLTEDCSLSDLEQLRPILVILASDMPSSTFEQTALAKCRDLQLRVLPVVGRASTILLGPLEIPGTPGCATCLQLRFEHTIQRSRLKVMLKQQVGRSVESAQMPLMMSQADLVTVSDIVSDELAGILLKEENPANCEGKVGVYSTAELLEWVPVLPSHDCPRCRLLPDDDPAHAHVQFQSHRLGDLDALRVGAVDFNRLEALYVHPKVGYISAVHELWNGDHYVRASAQICTPTGAEHVGYGSGLTIVDAKRSAMLEVLERSCGFQASKRRPVVFGHYAEFQDIAVHPSRFGLHGDELLQMSNHMLEPFSEEKKYSWVWAYSTMSKKTVLVPEQTAYYGWTNDEKRFIKETSNGCALGGTVEEAVLHGIFEVLERDGILNMWYARLPIPELKLDKHCPSRVSRVIELLENEGYEIRLFNASHDLCIPVVFAVAVRAGEHAYPKVVSGSACHLNPYEAVYGALRELTVQVFHLQGTSEIRRTEALSMLLSPTSIQEILDHVVVGGLPEAYPRWEFLLSGERRTPIHSVQDVYADAVRPLQSESLDIRSVLNAVLDDLHSRGFDVLVVDQTSSEVACGELHAVKVLIPGMTPIAFGYGFRRVRGLSRVFELPYQMGYSTHVLTESDLNEDCHPFS
ncbi:TOMM precursor leader peptide-binding protein [Alicyclobacillus fastidiosus]|uniref:TOMM leader peptide-binding protein n=1 Tax=Alicyclobacillus fastidiosus TaxID=392011 RepID=A0ABV5AAG8_9BACL|nr:TOMM precursor leader peptide-binding protein [Alicyclobacillus fastidiosus]WEH07642.1 TOMM precursor leader peptide-binding protein [Alicyclobacillus fastidiosus]